MEYSYMTDDINETVDPFHVLDALDLSVSQLEAILNQSHEGAKPSDRQRNSPPAIPSTTGTLQQTLREREQLFKQLINHITEVFWIASPDGRSLTYISELSRQLWGRAPEEFYRDPVLWSASICEQDREAFKGAVDSLVSGGSASAVLQFSIVHADGEQRLLRCRFFLVPGKGGTSYPAGVVEDITQSSLQDKELMRSLSLLRATLDSTTDGILVLDTSGDILDYNSRFLDMWGVAQDVIEQMNSERLLCFLSGQLHDPDNIQLDPTNFGDRVLLTRFDTYLECSLRPLQLGKKVYGMLWSCRNITEQMRAQELVHYQATYDQLTRLPNRTLLLERLDLSLSRCKRYGRIGALLFLDLDNFKTINDTLGHPVGDDLLTEVANRLKHCLRQEDTAARLGGDEFVLLLSEFEAKREKVSEQANIVAEKVLETLTRPYEIDGHRLYVTASIGIALFPGEGEDAADVLKQADTAMYRAKESGRNTFRFYYPNMQQVTEARLHLQNDLHQALERNEFSLYWHPLFDHTGSVVGAEALLRWRHPERGLILPDSFIRLAEETGLMRNLGDWVLYQTTQFLKTLEADMPQLGAFYVAVNVGVHQFQQIDFAERVQHFLRINNANPSRLVIELREDTLVGNHEIILEKMLDLKRLGVRFSIDDFGTGLSSLANLKKLPLDEVKIDRSFVNEVIRDPETVDIVEAMISMAGKLGLGVVAEGVESHKERDFLARKGCKRFQGVYYCEPMPTETFWTYLQTRDQISTSLVDQQSTFEGF